MKEKFEEWFEKNKEILAVSSDWESLKNAFFAGYMAGTANVLGYHG